MGKDGLSWERYEIVMEIEENGWNKSWKNERKVLEHGVGILENKCYVLKLR